MDKKRNLTFEFLYALAIIMVIDDHCSTRIGLLSSIFPYNSFYMPLFVFASGYFFQAPSLKDYLVKRIKRLLIPYIIWNIVAVAITYLIDFSWGLKWGEKISLQKCLYSLIFQPPTYLNSPSWFAINLFWVSIVYAMIRKLVGRFKYCDVWLTIVFIGFGFFTLILCIPSASGMGYFSVWETRLLFFIQFYHLGHMFGIYGERWLQKANKVIVCLACMLINSVLIMIYGSKVDYYGTVAMGGFHYWYLPIITSCTGIIFYYEVMEFVSRKIGENKLIQFISRNTFVMMECHLFFLNIPNFYIYHCIQQGSQKYMDFDINFFMSSAGYRYNGNARLIAFWCGLLGSLFVAYLIEKGKHILKGKH